MMSDGTRLSIPPRPAGPTFRPRLSGIALAAVLLGASATAAQAQPASICARVKIEILQRLTFERVAFDAKLVVTNNLATEPLTGFGVTLHIMTLDGTDVGDRFFTRVNDLTNISDINGGGEIATGVQAEAHWLIIPSYGAGGTDPLGQTYFVSGTVNFQTSSGPKQLELFPAGINVRPQPLLDVDYALPRQVFADDPFTEAVEAPVPFSLGVRVVNRGYGTAGNLHITSGQPKIVENKQGLLIAFRLLGTTVNGAAVQPTLDAAFGTIAPQRCGVADWQMATTLSGEFISFDAQYTHAPELGGELTSLIHETSANTLVHEMLVDLPGRDNIKDFLVDTDKDPERLPDQILESDCGDLPVNVLSGSTVGNPSSFNPEVPLAMTGLIPGWVFTRVPDPSDGLIPLAQVIRSDGKRLRPENFWILPIQDTVNRALYHYFVNVIDSDTTGSYTLVYQRPAADSTPPVTSIIFQEPSFGTNPTFITADSQIIFTATDDISGVRAIEYLLDNDPGGFKPAFPFNITAAGPHVIAFRSTDRAGNREADQSVNVVVDQSPPAIDPIAPSPPLFMPSAPEGAAAARQTFVNVRAVDAVPDLPGTLDIARGTGVSFEALPLVRSIPVALRSGIARTLVWDGRSAAGVVVPAGLYTLRVTLNDHLGHSSSALATVEVREYVEQTAAVPAAGADQQLPDLRGTRLVWQDNRGGDWDVFTVDLAGGPAVDLTTGQPADQMKPRTDGRYVVWQDRRNGNWDIFLYDLTTGATRPFATEIADQENPVVEAPWVVWQENRSGQYDVVAKNIDTLEVVEVSAGDPGVHDQIRPSISGTTIAFEDYRFGLGEIFTYDLAARTERRITNDINNQTQPTIDGTTVVWVDERNQNRDLYMFDLVSGAEKRLTYTKTDESQPSLRSGRIAYVDYSAGLGDPAIALYRIVTRRALIITADPNRQEEPATDADRVAWQDNRTGRWQIMTADVALDALPISRPLGPGLNLVGITDAEASAHPSAFSLVAAWSAASGVVAVEKFDPATGRFRSARIGAGGAPEGDEFPVVAGDALIARASAARALSIAGPVSCAAVALSPGANYVSLPCVPPGFTAKDLIEALGPSKITSISRYDSSDGRWKALAVDAGKYDGEVFPLAAGEGYLVYAREAAGPFLP
jgi:beta propeller repeat protein